MRKATKIKDFTKQTRKVGRRKVPSNDTASSALESRRIFVPAQKLDIRNDDKLVEYLVGLKHYNNKKRVDAINGLMRSGATSIALNHLSEVLSCLGFGLSDEDEAVRTKCASFLLTVLNELEVAILQPFGNRLFLQLRSCLSNVNPEIRGSSLKFLCKLACGSIFSQIEISELIKGLVELNKTTVVSRGRSQTDGEQTRFDICMCIERLIYAMKEKCDVSDVGMIDPLEWTVSSITNRAIAAPSNVGSEISKLILALERQGEEVMLKRIKDAASNSHVLSQEASHVREISQKKMRKHKSLNSGGVFSKLTSIMRRDVDS